MSVDWAVHYDALYEALGVEALLEVGTAGPAPLTAIDKTAGVEVDGMSGADVQTIRPVAGVRVAELADNGIAREALRGGTITLNGKAWSIHSYLSRPAPAGGDLGGEIWLILKEG